MTAIVLYFQVHQPWRLRRYDYFDIGQRHDWFDDATNERILRRVAERCYRHTNELILRLVERTSGAFRCAFSVTGTVLDQMERWAPEALASFQRLAETGAVEFLAETSHHSLAFLGEETEFRAQVEAQSARIERTFGVRPRTFRNTELIVDRRVARIAEEMGFRAILGEGADHVLGWRSATRVYRPTGCRRIRLLLRSYALSDDIAFRFSARDWAEWPLSPEKFVRWVGRVPQDAEVVGLFMDHETLGEHQGRDSGIHDFLEALPAAVAEVGRFRFATPREVIAPRTPAPALDLPRPVSWADAERDVSAWLGNDLQRAAHAAVWSLAPAVRAAGDPTLAESWRRLTTSDHVYYMSTKFWSDGDVHRYFSPYPTPHEAFVNFMNVLDDVARQVEARSPRTTARMALPRSSRKSHGPFESRQCETSDPDEFTGVQRRRPQGRPSPALRGAGRAVGDAS